MTTERIDVLSVMDRASRRYAAGSRAGQEMRDASAAVAELVDKAKQAEARLTYINIQSGEAVDADLVIALRAALAPFQTGGAK